MTVAVDEQVSALKQERADLKAALSNASGKADHFQKELGAALDLLAKKANLEDDLASALAVIDAQGAEIKALNEALKKAEKQASKDEAKLAAASAIAENLKLLA